MERDDLADLEKNGTVGDWTFGEKAFYIWIKYPGREGEAPSVLRLPLQSQGIRGWKWNGSRDKPTLQEKIDVLYGRSFRLKEGKLEEA